MRHNRGVLNAGSLSAATAVHRQPSRLRRVAVAAAVFVLIVPQTSCFFRKHKVVEPQVRTPSRIVLLPINIPQGNAELRWVAMAAPVLMAKAIENSPDLEIVPLWESMPVTKETVGDSRTITAENAEYIASRLTAKWAAQGEIAADKAGISILLDFIPAKATLVPFRYEKKGPLASLGTYMDEAFEQFLRYLVAPPPQSNKRLDPNSIRPVAEAIDREYGWFVEPEPGKSESVVAGFAQTDRPIAALLFNPNLYPGIQTKPAGGAPPALPNKPAAPTAAPSPAPTPTPPAGSPPQQLSSAEASRNTPQTAALTPAATSTAAQDDDVEIPPPRTFVQRINSPPPPAPSAPPSKPVAARAARESKTAPAPLATNEPAPASTPLCGIQVFASRSRSQAERLLARLTGAGLQPQLQRADLKEKGVWYRVRLQGYPSRTAALAAGDKLRADALIQDYWLVR